MRLRNKMYDQSYAERPDALWKNRMTGAFGGKKRIDSRLRGLIGGDDFEGGERCMMCKTLNLLGARISREKLEQKNRMYEPM